MIDKDLLEKDAGILCGKNKEYLKSFNYEVDLFQVDINNYKNIDIKDYNISQYNLIGLSNYS